MPTALTDTDPESARSTSTCALQGASAAEAGAVGLRFVELAYGADLAAGVRERLRAVRS